MRVFFKYLIWLFSLLSLTIYFLLGTQLGHKLMGSILGTYLSSKTHNSIEVDSLNLEYYPMLYIDMKINNVSKVHLVGTANRELIDMNYHLVGEQYRWNNFFIDGVVNVKGKLRGSFSALEVEGTGMAFDGNTTYEFIKKPKKFEKMNVRLINVKSEALMKFLNYKPLFRGRADIESHFEEFSTYSKEGEAKIFMSRGFMPTVAPYVPFVLNTTIDFENISYKLNGKIESDIGTLKISEGKYHSSRKEGSAEYDLKLKNLVYFEELLKHRYEGKLNTIGSLEYKEGKFSAKGKTDRFDGVLTYTYSDENLDLDLKGLSLVKMLREYHYPALLSAKVYGDIDYNIKDKIVLINTVLKGARFRETKMTNMIYNTTGINMLSEVYDQSSFVAGYQNERLTAVLKIDNGRNHIYLNNTVLNAKTNSIDSDFEVQIHGEELAGKIYGTLEDPSVSVDMKKLIKYQVEKRFGSWFGTKKTEHLKSTVKKKLNNIDLEDAKNKASSLINNIFN